MSTFTTYNTLKSCNIAFNCCISVFESCNLFRERSINSLNRALSNTDFTSVVRNSYPKSCEVTSNSCSICNTLISLCLSISDSCVLSSILSINLAYFFGISSNMIFEKELNISSRFATSHCLNSVCNIISNFLLCKRVNYYVKLCSVNSNTLSFVGRRMCNCSSLNLLSEICFNISGLSISKKIIFNTLNSLTKLILSSISLGYCIFKSTYLSFCLSLSCSNSCTLSSFNSSGVLSLKCLKCVVSNNTSGISLSSKKSIKIRSCSVVSELSIYVRNFSLSSISIERLSFESFNSSSKSGKVSCLSIVTNLKCINCSSYISNNCGVNTSKFVFNSFNCGDHLCEISAIMLINISN